MVEMRSDLLLFKMWIVNTFDSDKQIKLHLFDCTDGRVKLWVYAVTVVGFIVILFVIALSFLVWYVLQCSLKKLLTVFDFESRSFAVDHTLHMRTE